MKKQDKIRIKDEPKLREGEKAMTILKNSLEKWGDAALFIRFYVRFFSMKDTIATLKDKVNIINDANKHGDINLVRKSRTEIDNLRKTTVSNDIKSKLPFAEHDQLISYLIRAMQNKLTDDELIGFYKNFRLNKELIDSIGDSLKQLNNTDQDDNVKAYQTLNLMIKETPAQLMNWILNGRRVIHIPSGMTERLQAREELRESKWSDVVLPLDSFMIELEEPYIYGWTETHAIAVSTQYDKEDNKWVRLELYFSKDGEFDSGNKLTRQQRVKLRGIIKSKKFLPNKEAKLLSTLIGKFQSNDNRRSLELIYREDTNIFEDDQSEDIIVLRCIVANTCKLLERARTIEQSSDSELFDDMVDVDSSDDDKYTEDLNTDSGSDIFSIDNRNIHNVTRIVGDARKGVPFRINKTVAPHVRRKHWRTLKNHMIGTIVNYNGSESLIDKENFIGPPNKTLISQMRIHPELFGESGTVRSSVTNLQD